MTTIQRPQQSEYDAYYHRYLKLVPDGDILAILADQRDRMSAILAAADEDKGNHRYEPGKWSLKEVVGHVIDAERVFGLRAVWFARGDSSPLPGMEQDDWAAAANYAARSVTAIRQEYLAVREASLLLFGSFTDEATVRSGICDGKSISVRSLIYLAAGHEQHHEDVLRRRYL